MPTLKCKSCGAPIEYSSNDKMIKCPVCNASQSVDEPDISAASETLPLLKRAFMFLEDGDFYNGCIYCERVLDADPENGEAYLGRLMAELRVSRREYLANYPYPFDRSINYEKIMRFGSNELKREIAEYLAAINGQQVEKMYVSALSFMSSNTENGMVSAISIFQSIKSYKDSERLLEECAAKLEKIREEKRKRTKRMIKIIVSSCAVIIVAVLLVLTFTVFIPNARYDKALQLMNEGKYEESLEILEELEPDFKDTHYLIKEVKNSKTI